MTTIKQQISLIEYMRESFDNNQREAIMNRYTPTELAELLRDIHENLIAMKWLQLAENIKLCNDCNQPIEKGRPVNVCERCTELRKLKAENHSVQL